MRRIGRKTATVPIRNHSWNCGVEGHTDDPAIFDLRARQQRNLLATLLLSQGVPMLLAGDEAGNSQQGNNNAYCQDNEIGWINWANAGQGGVDLTEFVCRLIALRKSHLGLRRNSFLTGTMNGSGGLKDVTWLVPDGREMTDEDWNYPEARSLCFLLAGYRGHPDADAAADAPLLVVLNAHHELLRYVLPKIQSIETWDTVIDTSDASGHKSQSHRAADTSIDVEPRSVVVFIGRPAGPALPQVGA